MTIPSSPNTMETETIQNTNSATPSIEVAPKKAAMTSIPSAVMTERTTTTAMTPASISA